MNNIKTLTEFINESIKSMSSGEIIDWLKERSGRTFIAVDTETTGLGGPRKEQLTQVSGVAFDYDPSTMTFKEKESFNEKISLTPETVKRKKESGSKIPMVLGMTRYGVRKGKFSDEQEVLNGFYDFIEKFNDPVLIIQNAPFDMPMLNIRRKMGGIKKEIFDSKDFLGYFLLPTLEKLAEDGDVESKNILDKIGRSSSGKVPTSSLPKVAGAFGIDPKGAHDALYDCRYMIKTVEKALQIIEKNKDLETSKYKIPRFSLDKYLKQKDKEKRK